MIYYVPATSPRARASRSAPSRSTRPACRTARSRGSREVDRRPRDTRARRHVRPFHPLRLTTSPELDNGTYSLSWYDDPTTNRLRRGERQPASPRTCSSGGACVDSIVIITGAGRARCTSSSSPGRAPKGPRSAQGRCASEAVSEVIGVNFRDVYEKNARRPDKGADAKRLPAVAGTGRGQGACDRARDRAGLRREDRRRRPGRLVECAPGKLRRPGRPRCVALGRQARLKPDWALCRPSSRRRHCCRA